MIPEFVNKLGVTFCTDAIERAIPMKVGVGRVDGWYTCPKCRHIVDYPQKLDLRENYCCKCGQNLDYSEIDYLKRKLVKKQCDQN